MKLKPCPFCSEQDNIYLQSNAVNSWWVECGKCMGAGPYKEYKDEAEEAWNHRTPHEYTTALGAILATLELDKETKDSIDRAIAGVKGE